MTGKEKCRVLRRIRRDVAEANGIPVTERECTHQGDCRGTCPYCEAELKKLEGALEEKRSLGQRIAVMGLSVGLLAVNLTACDLPFLRSTAGEPLMGDVPAPEQVEHTDTIPGELVESQTTTTPPTTEMGVIPVPETLMGDPVLPEETATAGVPMTTELPEETVIMGTVAVETTNLPIPPETP